MWKSVGAEGFVISDLVHLREVWVGLLTPLLLVSGICYEDTSDKDLSEDNVGCLSFCDGSREKEDVCWHCNEEEEKLYLD